MNYFELPGGALVNLDQAFSVKILGNGDYNIQVQGQGGTMVMSSKLSKAETLRVVKDIKRRCGIKVYD